MQTLKDPGTQETTRAGPDNAAATTESDIRSNGAALTTESDIRSNGAALSTTRNAAIRRTLTIKLKRLLQWGDVPTAPEAALPSIPVSVPPSTDSRSRSETTAPHGTTTAPPTLTATTTRRRPFQHQRGNQVRGRRGSKTNTEGFNESSTDPDLDPLPPVPTSVPSMPTTRPADPRDTGASARQERPNRPPVAPKPRGVGRGAPAMLAAAHVAEGRVVAMPVPVMVAYEELAPSSSVLTGTSSGRSYPTRSSPPGGRDKPLPVPPPDVPIPRIDSRDAPLPPLPPSHTNRPTVVLHPEHAEAETEDASCVIPRDTSTYSSSSTVSPGGLSAPATSPLVATGRPHSPGQATPLGIPHATQAMASPTRPAIRTDSTPAPPPPPPRPSLQSHERIPVPVPPLPPVVHAQAGQNGAMVMDARALPVPRADSGSTSPSSARRALPVSPGTARRALPVSPGTARRLPIPRAGESAPRLLAQPSDGTTRPASSRDTTDGLTQALPAAAAATTTVTATDSTAAKRRSTLGADWRQALWYHGRMEREQAERVLKTFFVDGAFLVRTSNNSPHPVLTFVTEGTIHHSRIRVTDAGEFYLGDSAQPRIFASMFGLIQHYMGTILREPIRRADVA